MRVRFPSIILSAFYCSCALASAEFEKWKDTQGRSAEMEIVDVRGEADKTEVEFRLKSGRRATLALINLDADGQSRVASWRKREPKLTAKFIRIQTEKDLGGGMQGLGRKGNPANGGQRADQKAEPFLSFGFTIHGENIVGLEPQQPVVTSVKVGNQRSFRWAKAFAFPARTPSRVSFGVKGHGEYNVEDLKSSEFSGSVNVLTSPGPKVVQKNLKLPSKQGEKLTYRVGDLTISAEWTAAEDPFAKGAQKTIRVSATGPHFLQVIETNVELDGVAIGQRVPVTHAGKNALVKIKAWDKLREVRVTLTKRADDPGLEIVTDDDI
jgi:hypothetical protein